MIGPAINSIIDVNCDLSIIGGGYTNSIVGNGIYSNILNGYQNRIQINDTVGNLNTIINGNRNEIRDANPTTANYCTIGNGLRNTITGSYHATILAGQDNVIAGANQSAIVNGFSNSIVHANSVVLGGSNFSSQASSSTNIAGRLFIKTVPTDNTEAYVLTWNSSDYSVEARSVASIGGGGGTGGSTSSVTETNNVFTHNDGLGTTETWDMPFRFDPFNGGNTRITTSNSGGNTVGANDSGILGGRNNNIVTGADRSIIIGGTGNQVSSSGQNSVIQGGIVNRTASQSSGVVAGNFNYAGGQGSFVGGGSINRIQQIAAYSGIIGGQNNTLSAQRALILGGTTNEIAASSNYSVIIGGSGNLINSSSINCFINGANNTIANGSDFGVILGRNNNIGNTFAAGNVKIFGNFNTVNGNSGQVIIGENNTNNSAYARIFGQEHTIAAGGPGQSILGGKNNTINSGVVATIVGGSGNLVITGNFGIIAGGRNNNTTGNYTSLLSSEGCTSAGLGSFKTIIGSNTCQIEGSHNMILGSNTSSIDVDSTYSNIASSYNSTIVDVNYGSIIASKNCNMQDVNYGGIFSCDDCDIIPSAGNVNGVVLLGSRNHNFTSSETRPIVVIGHSGNNIADGDIPGGVDNNDGTTVVYDFWRRGAEDTSCDIRRKKNINDLEPFDLNAFMNIRCIQFHRLGKDDRNPNKSCGFLVQNLDEQGFDQCIKTHRFVGVTGPDETPVLSELNSYTFEPDSMISILTRICQQQQDLILNLQNRVEHLESVAGSSYTGPTGWTFRQDGPTGYLGTGATGY